MENNNKENINKKAWWKGIGGAVTFLALIGVVVLLPDIQRYMKIRSM